MRLLWRLGKEFANGEDVVDERVQKRRMAGSMRAAVIRLDVDMLEFPEVLHLYLSGLMDGICM